MRRSIAIEWRLADSYERYPVLAAELVRLNVDVIVTPNTPGALAAKRATTTIPIVFTAIADPVGSGFVTSLGRPGGNLTGLSNTLVDVSAKLLALLKETAPKTARVAMLFNTSNAGNVRSAKETQDAPLDPAGPISSDASRSTSTRS
jgi:putative ABC transport system substrate-binding protein